MRHAVLLTLLIACRASAPASETPAPPPANLIDAARVDKVLTPHIASFGRHWGERRKFNGYVMIAQHDRVIYGRGFGFADRDARAVPTADTSFRIGSVTKQFTATAILLLQEDGKLAVGDTVGAHLPEYPAVGAGVTIHQLLTHTSGIPSYTSFADLEAIRDRPITVEGLLATFWDRPLEFAPGSEHRYSNSGYAVLGAIIERVSGQRYADFLAARVFGPAGLTRTMVGDADGLDDRALGYELDGDQVVPAAPIDMSVPFAAGAVRSTPNDLVRWHRALAGDQILSEASKAAMYTPALDGYAYGWDIADVEGHRRLSHGGGIDGFTCEFVRVPDLDLVIVAWSNGGLGAGVIATAALHAALDLPLEPVEETPLVALDLVVAGRLVGTYALTAASRAAATTAGIPPGALDSIATITLTVEDGRLVMTPVGQSSLPLHATSATTFLEQDHGVTMAADDAAGTITLTQGGISLTYAR